MPLARFRAAAAGRPSRLRRRFIWATLVSYRGAMVTLYSYPGLFGGADNNGYGLKVFAFMRLAGVSFRHEHIFDASAAPRGQLPYDDGETIGDSEAIIAHLVGKYGLTIDDVLATRQSDQNLLITRMLDVPYVLTFVLTV
jgi:Glutathione S-transferase N-terminal domain